ncbi:MAG: hypothetical protein LBD88_01500 [Candidatus Peribacteria bacterium]|nr:hypothetical protein [Candidatus Peribacteria bacterium]
MEITSQELENRKNKVNNILNNAKIISQELKSVELNLIKTYTPSPPPKKRPEDYIRRWNFEE